MEMEMEDRDDAHRRFRDYLLALEEERRKIHVFQRELPLCLDLVTQTIEGMRRSQIDVVGSDHGPVLEEFIPLKPSFSSDEDSTHEAVPANNAAGQKDEINNNKVMMPDWLQSVQLWSQQPQQSSLNNKELPCKPVALNATKGGGGAFHPFDKDKRAEAELPAASSATGAASSAVVGDSGDKAASDTGDEYEEEKEDTSKVDKAGRDKDKEEGQSQQPNGRKPRRCWAPELHRRFLQALQQLGGSHAATPKQIRELMKVEGLTNDEVKSHLQKYRLHTTRRPGPGTTTAQSSAAAPQPPAPQFVVVGSCIWVPQPEYATRVSAHPRAEPATANVYAPVATLPSPHKQKQHKSSHSEVRPSGETGDASSASPAVSSSSSQTTSA